MQGILAIVYHGGAVGDEKDCLLFFLGLRGDVGDELLLGLGVEGTGSLVQEQDVALSEQGAGYGNALCLPLGEACAALSANGVDGLRQSEDEIGTCQSECLMHVCLGGQGVPQEQVVANGSA